MATLRIEQIIQRLGMHPSEWDFRGQCYDCGEGNYRTCALTLKPTRFCYTLKPKDGRKGKATIGPAAFYLLRLCSPELYIKLNAGRLWLTTMVEAAEADLRRHSMLKKRTATQKRLVGLRTEAKKRIKAYRLHHKEGELPESLEALRLLIGKKHPDLHDPEAETLWAEQSALELEQHLLTSPAEDEQPPSAAHEPPFVVLPNILPPLPEIVF